MVKSFIILQIIQCCKNLLSGQFCLQNVKCYFMNLTATTCILRKSYISNQTSQQFQCESCSLNRQDLMSRLFLHSKNDFKSSIVSLFQIFLWIYFLSGKYDRLSFWFSSSLSKLCRVMACR